MNLKRVTAVLLSAVMMLSVTASDISAVPLSIDDDGSVLVSEETEEEAYSDVEEDEDELLNKVKNEAGSDDAVYESKQYSDMAEDESQGIESEDEADEYGDDNPGTDAELSEDEAIDEDEFLEGNGDENGEEHGLGNNDVPREEELESISVYADDVDDSFQDIDLEADLPSEYRTPILPGLRDQGRYGTCWAHSAMATAEINMMKQGLQNNPNYSELQLAYFSYEKDENSSDPLGGTAGDINRAIYSAKKPNFLQIGGNHAFSSNVLASWIGAADETAVPYSNAEYVLSNGLPGAYAYEDVAHLKNFYEVRTDTEDDRKAIKRIVRDCGAAEVSMYMISGYGVGWDDGVSLYKSEVYNSSKNCYYFPLSDRATNHSVTIVGWDDDFPASYFASASGDDSAYPSDYFTRVPEGNGAWLIRNSWSEGTSDYSLEGYFWLSYYDKSTWTESAYGYEFGNTVYDNNYQYDGAMKTGGRKFGTDTIYMANVFTAHACNDGEMLKAVSIAPYENTNVDYEIKVYKYLTDDTDPTSGTVVSTVTGKTTYAGFYTVPLLDQVDLAYGEKFSVVVKFSKSGDVVYAPVEVSQKHTWYDITAHSEKGQSFRSYDGESWLDNADSGIGNIRVKAFTCDDNSSKYTVTLNANGGVMGSGAETYTKPIKVGNPYGVLPEPTRKGYEFTGWYTSADDGGTLIESTDMVPGDITLYAHWSMKEYKLTLKANYGSFDDDTKEKTVKIRYGEPYGELPAPIRTGYEFIGYYTSEYSNKGELITADTLYLIDGDSTIYERWDSWTVADYKVTFDANGGTVSPEYKYVQYLEEYGELPTPVREGYNFIAWYTALTGGSEIYESRLVLDACDHTLYARWTGKKITVRFDANGGSCSTSSKEVYVGDKYYYLTTPSRDGYDFAGWYTAAEGGTLVDANSTVEIVKNHTLYAHWTGSEYTLTFDANGGSCSKSSKTIVFKNAYGELPTPTNPGYDFAGWYTAKTGGKLIEENTVVSADNFDLSAYNHKVYAHWTPSRITVTLDPCGGTCSASEVTVTFKDKYPALPPAERENYEFLGWYLSETDYSAVTTDTEVKNPQEHTLYARWIGKRVTVSFDGNGYTGVISPITVRYKEKYGNLPTSPERAGYEPDGWFTAATGGDHITASSIVEIASDHTLYVHWTGKKYTLTLDANGGTCSDGTKEVTYGSEYGNLPTPTRAGYNFAGWYTAKTGGTKIEPETKVSEANFNINASNTVYARWTGKEVAVTFDVNGGNVLPEAERTKTVYYAGEYGDLPVPTRNDYDFVGWYKNLSDAEPITKSSTVSTAEAHTLHAKWIGHELTVTCIYNDGTEHYDTRTVRYLGTYGMNGQLPEPTRAGYDFAGWYTAESGGDKITSATAVQNASDHNLYAHWTGKEYTLTFDKNGGSCSTGTKKVVYGSAYGELPEPTRENYDFDGWYTAKTGGTKIEAATIVSDANFNINASNTVYARWTGKKVTVTFDVNGGNELPAAERTKVVNFASTYGELPDPTSTGYDFVGWFMNLDDAEPITKSTAVSTAAAHTLHAKWIGHELTVTCRYNDGTDRFETRTVRYLGTYGTLPEPTRAGYDFDGWFTAESDGTKITSETTVDNQEAHNLYAHWTGKEYTITFDVNGGNELPEDKKTKEVVFGSKYGDLPTPSKPGYVFDGWHTAKTGGKLIDKDKVVSTDNFDVSASSHKVYAKWNPKQYTIEFDPNGGTVQTSTKQVIFGNTYGDLPTPARSGFEFAGWFTEKTGGKLIDKDTTVSAENLDPASDTRTLYAHWEGKELTVKFEAGGKGGRHGNISNNMYQKKVRLGGQYGELPGISVFRNYEFLGWFTEEIGGEQVTSETAVTDPDDHTLYAHYKGKDVALTFDVNGGKPLSEDQKTRTAEFGSAYGDLPVPERDGYDFLGWYYSLDADDTIAATAATLESYPAAHTLYARWSIRRYTLTLDANGGSWDSDGSIVQTITKDWNSLITSDVLSSFGKPVSGNKRFAGWFRNPDGTGEFAVGEKITGDVTLYAKWNEIEPGFFCAGLEDSYTFTGDQIKPVITVYDNSITPDRPLVEKVDYTISYSNNVNVGRADDEDIKKRPTITITGKGIYQKTQSVYFTIAPASLDTGDGKTFADGFEVTLADKAYNGKKQISKPTIKYGKKSLAENKDYTVTYDGDTLVNGEPTNAGKVTVKIEAKQNSNYTGRAEAEYYIYDKARSIGSAYVAAIDDRPYTGKPISLAEILPYIEVKESKNGAALMRGNENDAAGDYFVRFANGTNTKDIGTVTLDIIGKGRFSGSRKVAKFKIVAADINSFTMEVGDAVYDGTAKKPKVTVYSGTGDDKVTLVEDRDYTVAYSNNVNAADAGEGNTNPKAVVKGKGNYKGTRNVPFAIRRLELSGSDLDISVPNMKLANGKAYTAKDISTTVTYYNPAIKKSVKLASGKDYDTEFTYSQDGMMQTLSITLKGSYMNDPDVNGGKIEKKFLMCSNTLDIVDDTRFEVKADTEGLVYTGSAIKPKITLVYRYDGCRTVLSEGKDFKVTYSNNTNAGNKDSGDKAPSWKLTGAGIFKGTRTGTFTIEKRDLREGYELSVPDVKCNGRDQKPTVKVIDLSTGKTLPASNYTVTVKPDLSNITDEAEYVVEGKGNYCGPLSTKIRVYQNAVSASLFEKIGEQYYTGGRITPDVKILPTAESGGFTNECFEIVDYGINTKTGTGTVTVKGKGAYGGTVVLKFKIVPRWLSEIKRILN